MKILLKIVGAVVIVLIVALIVLRITGLDPNDAKRVKDRRAGLWLKGNLVSTPVTDWSFTNNYDTIEIETNTWFGIPHSVRIDCATLNGHLYLNSRVAKGVAPYPGGKMWNRDVARDPRVRLKIGNNLYPEVLVFITDPAEKDAAFKAMQTKYPHFGLTPGGTINIFRVENDTQGGMAKNE